MFELCASILAADFANLERDMRAWCVRWNA